MSDDDPYVYDKAKYHHGSVEDAGLPEAHAYHHTTYFYAWLVRHDMLSDEWKRDLAAELARYRAGETTINDLYEFGDTCLVSDMLSAEGNAFARAYFDFERGQYLADYAEHAQKDLPTEFHVPYTAAIESALHRVIDGRYQAWKARR